MHDARQRAQASSGGGRGRVALGALVVTLLWVLYDGRLEQWAMGAPASARTAAATAAPVALQSDATGAPALAGTTPPRAAKQSKPVLPVEPVVFEIVTQPAVGSSPAPTIAASPVAAPPGSPGALVHDVDVHAADRMPTDGSCNATGCGADALARPDVALLHDPRTNRSDTVPQLSVEMLRKATGASKIDGHRWATAELADEIAAFEAAPPGETASAVPYLSCVQRNAAVGFAVGFGPAVLQPLIASFQRYATPCDDLVLFVDDTAPDVAIDRTKGNVLLLPRAPFVAKIKLNVGDAPATQRIGVIAVWVEENWKRYKYVMQVDTRDLLFFANPFAALYRNNVTGLFSVSETMAFKKEFWNQMWTDNYAGADIKNFVNGVAMHGRDLRVICSGLYGGNSLALLDYLGAFAKGADVASAAAKKILGIDQGIHIYLQVAGLALAGYPHRILLLDEAVGPMRHWYARDAVAVRDHLGKFVNCHKKVYSVLHQLDRYGFWWNEALSAYRTRRKRLVHKDDDFCANAAADAGNRTVFAAARAAVAVVQRTPVAVETTQMVPITEKEHAATPLHADVPRAEATRELWRHYVHCAQRHAILLHATSFDEAALQPLIAAAQRYHTPCEDIVVFVPRAADGKYPAISYDTEFAARVFFVTPRKGQKELTATATVQAWLATHGARYNFVAVLEDALRANAVFYNNIFVSMYSEPAEFHGLWLVPLGAAHPAAAKCGVSDERSAAVSPKVYGGCAQAVADFLAVTAAAVKAWSSDDCSADDVRAVLVAERLGSAALPFSARVSLADRTVGAVRHEAPDDFPAHDQHGHPLSCAPKQPAYALVAGYDADDKVYRQWFKEDYGMRGQQAADKTAAWYGWSVDNYACAK
jgi:hypothetical protein